MENIVFGMQPAYLLKKFSCIAISTDHDHSAKHKMALKLFEKGNHLEIKITIYFMILMHI